MARPKRSQAEWTKVVAKYRASGLTAEVFAARHDLNVSTLRWWSAEIESAGPSVPALRELVVQAAGARSGGGRAHARRDRPPTSSPNRSSLRGLRRGRARRGQPRVLMLPRSVRVWLATEPVDMRLGHDGLLGIVRSVFGLDPFGGHLFVFLGKRRDRCMILVSDRGRLVVHYKRLEKGRLSVPTKADGSGPASIEATDLAVLLDGIDVSRANARPVGAEEDLAGRWGLDSAIGF